MSTIDVSVIIPTFRRERELVEAVQSALGQAGVTVEVLVLDDSEEGSARAAMTALTDPRLRYLQQSVPSRGRPALVRNQGAQLARGRYVHFLDDDDRLADGALRAMVAALDETQRGVAVGWVVPFGDDPAWLKNKSEYFQQAATVGRDTSSSIWAVAHILFRGTLMVNSACMIRREHIAALGGFNPSIPVYEDVDFYLRAIRRFGHVYVNRPVLHYRTGKPSLMQNLGKDTSKVVVESYRIIHRTYKQDHGRLEYAALQLLTKSIPFSLLRRFPVPVPSSPRPQPASVTGHPLVTGLPEAGAPKPRPLGLAALSAGAITSLFGISLLP